MLSFGGVFAAEDNEPVSITIDYSGIAENNQTITVDFADEWLLQPDDEYNHKLMRSSFVLAAAGFRDGTKDLAHKDYNILDFFAQAGFTEPRTVDFDVTPSIDTIGTAIAYKKAGASTLIAVSVSGNNYQGEWAGNMVIDDDNRVKGFNDAADRVTERLEQYIIDYDLHGDLRLWTAGYSRSAAVVNDFAADAVDSGRFQGVYAYTFATPRTTREPNPGRYHYIFNLINPLDVIPMVPFPEWGFERYGIDLFLPAIETNSSWYKLAQKAIELYEATTGETIIINPQMDMYLHTLLDYVAYFIDSSAKYQASIQSPLVGFMETHSFRSLIHDLLKLISFDSIRDYLIRRNEVARYHMHEFYNFLDYLNQLLYKWILAKRDPENLDLYWEFDNRVIENLACNHMDGTYRSWLFSSDDPESLLSRESKYAHVVIRGDVDVEVYDENDDFIVTIDHDGNYLPYFMDIIRRPFYTGKTSDTLIYGERQGDRTLIVLPLDQTFSVGVYSHKDQTLRISYVEYSTDKLRGTVLYIYEDEFEAGEYYIGEFDSETEKLTSDELRNLGVLTVEPWSNEVVYSPTAVMRLENDGIPHPTPKLLIALIVFVMLLFVALIVLIVIGIIRIIKKILKKPAAVQ